MAVSVETIGETLRRRRKELGLTQGQLAARLGSTQSYVAQIERAAHRAGELSWLLQGSPNEEAPPLTGGSWDD